MALGRLLLALWLTSLLSTGSCFFGGTTMAGSEQLEAYIGYKCQEGKADCRHIVDVRHIYMHTNEGGMDSKLILGRFTYLVASVRTGMQGNFSILVHRGNFSTDTSTAAAWALDASQSANIITTSCEKETFEDPLLFVTIIRPDAAAANFDFSFALKKSTVTEGMHVLPAQKMAVLAVPVLGSLSGDAMSRYEVTVKVKSIFPDDTKLALRALGTQNECAAGYRAAAEEPFESKVWATSGELTSVMEVGHLEAGYLFLAVLGDSPKRQLVELEATYKVLVRDGLPGEAWPQQQPEDEDTFLRTMLLGDRLESRSDWWLANEAYKMAHALYPDDPAPAAKQLKVWLAASPQDKDMGADAGDQWSGEIRASALYGLVREIGDLARDVGSGADLGRSSMIRTSRDLLYQHISAAKTGSAELACIAGDHHGAELIVNETLAMLEHTDTAYMKAVWDFGQMFKRHGGWTQAIRLLKRLSTIDNNSWLVFHHYAVMLANGGRLDEAKVILNKALEKENGDKGTSLLLLAEVELSSQGCGVSKQVHDLIHKAGLEGAQTEGRGEALTAISYLCEEDLVPALAGYEHRCGELLSVCRELLGFGGRASVQCEMLPCAGGGGGAAGRGEGGERASG